MSPIIDQQRRLVEVGRIRMGEKRTAAQSGKQYPVKLSTWRLTSRDRTRLEAAAAVYGGTVRTWEDQHQLTTETDSLEIAVVPGQALSQYFEHWGQAHPKSHKGPNPVKCLLRCDGVTELLGDRPCVCAATGKDTCKRTTRLSVMLRRVPGIGMWRVDTRGEIAAGELIGGVEMLEMLTASQRPVRARLRLDQRTSIDQVTGETHNFVVPVLDIDMTLDEALDTLNGVARPEIGSVAPVTLPAGAAAELAAGPGFTPVGELPSAPVGTIADQVAGAGREARAPRKGAAQPIRPTGRRPRAAVEVVEGGTAAASTGGEGGGGGASQPSPPGVPGGEPTDATPDAAGDGDGVDGQSTAASPPGASPAATARAKHVAMRCRDVGIDSDEARHAFLALVTEGRAASGKDLDPADFALVGQVLEQLANGAVRLVHGIDGTWRLDAVGESTTADDEAFWGADRWKQFVKEHKKTQVAVLRHARAVAEELGVEPPAGFAEWQDGRISAAVRQWVETAA